MAIKVLPEAEQRVIKLLRQRGINVVNSQSKTSTIGVVVTEKPVDMKLLKGIKGQAGINGLYQDVPLPLPP